MALTENHPSPGILYVVAIDLGERSDLTLRARETLGLVDALICEEEREARRLLSYHGLAQKPLFPLNEHNRTEVEPLINELRAGRSLALISDCGTPLFADPGRELVAAALAAGIRLKPLPGPSSLAATLSVCPFLLDRFIYMGFPPREPIPRTQFFEEAARESRPVVLLDAPYRFGKIISELAGVCPERRLFIAFDLTLPGEELFLGTARSAATRNSGQKRKGEYTIVLEGKR